MIAPAALGRQHPHLFGRTSSAHPPGPPPPGMGALPFQIVQHSRATSKNGASTMQSTSLVGLWLFLGGAIGVPLGFALSQTAPQMHAEVLLQHRATDIPGPANLEVRYDRWDPGAETGEHEHPGPAILAVLDGELIEETPRGRNTLHAGEAVWRPAHERHNVKNVGSRAARVLAIHFDPVN
jgi:quercetin dioxygenase-like cupin family protein